jgi:hypothetical protein
VLTGSHAAVMLVHFAWISWKRASSMGPRSFYPFPLWPKRLFLFGGGGRLCSILTSLALLFCCCCCQLSVRGSPLLNLCCLSVWCSLEIRFGCQWRLSLICVVCISFFRFISRWIQSMDWWIQRLSFGCCLLVVLCLICGSHIFLFLTARIDKHGRMRSWYLSLLKIDECGQ